MKRQIRPFQFLKLALPNHLALLQQKDHITFLHRSQAMGNEDDGPLTLDLDKFEIRISKFETNQNDKNSNARIKTTQNVGNEWAGFLKLN
jgi:hypothetical protein